MLREGDIIYISILYNVNKRGSTPLLLSKAFDTVRELQLFLWCNLLKSVVVALKKAIRWVLPQMDNIDKYFKSLHKVPSLSSSLSVCHQHSNYHQVWLTLVWWSASLFQWNASLLTSHLKETPVSHRMFSRIFSDDLLIHCETHLCCACWVTHWGSEWFCLRGLQTRFLLQPSGCWCRSPHHPQRHSRTTEFMIIYNFNCWDDYFPQGREYNRRKDS